MNSDNRILVGDVGGTHARFAVVQPCEVGPWRILHRLDLAERFATFKEALRTYLERAGVTSLPPLAAIAVAGPVAAGTARFTNRGWDISEQALREVGFERALLINDFAALAFAVELLDERHLHAIGPPLKGPEGETITILGAGTGFGVSCLARYGDRAVPMATEGGHMSFAPGDAQELAALELMWQQAGRVSIERILSGDGLEHLYRTLEQLAGRAPAALTAAQISAAALRNEAGPRAALTMFCSIFGAVAGDLALAHGARGGVYIAGGIAEKIEGFLLQSPFRRRFEDKGRLSAYVAAIPTRLIVYPDIALLGAARSGLVLAPAASR
ncbi:MAG TPA: glucokinase [Steroidobacteraceae bacterium]|nr:glucokinase [Steroidobacteraceae bacterium]HUA23687.1 glucokinase [Steroidobacteraceae bacterium]